MNSRARKSPTCLGRNGPLMEFQTESDALDYMFEAGLQKTSPYKCQKCGKFHFSPKERMTPSKRCSNCGKDLYVDKAAAERRARIIAEEQGLSLATYPCPVAKGWHLTKR